MRATSRRPLPSLGRLPVPLQRTFRRRRRSRRAPLCSPRLTGSVTPPPARASLPAPLVAAAMGQRQVWKIISPWLDEEILQKTFFLPKAVRTAEEAIEWIDRKRLPDPTQDPWHD